ncbi:MAG: hypothetical protein IKT05_06395 [Fibrobacter sp.]|nr:hypothetical protein [Fibrobacter sp.]
MRLVAVALLLLSSLLFAETQESVYFRALKAEESGDVAAALAAFEEAVQIPGPYTQEIREIIDEYYDALGVTTEEKNPWSFRFLGDLGFYGLHYNEYGGVEKVSEIGGDIFVALTPFIDYSTGEWIHSFGLGFSGDWFVANEDMPVLDTNDWNISLGLEYSLIGKSLMLDVGADIKVVEGAYVSPNFYAWVERDFYRFEKQRIGVATWGYYDPDGPLSFALYGAWHRTVPYGLNGSIYVGARFEADSAVDYVDYLAAYKEALDESSEEQQWGEFGSSNWGGWYGQDPMRACLQTYGDQCFQWNIAKIDSIYGAEQASETAASISVPKYYAKWFGPTLRSRVSYKFKRNITLEAKLNLFYGFVLDGPDSDYEKMRKFSGVWGAMFYWKPNALTLYLGAEQFYKHYSLPEYYRGVYPRNSLLSELKAGFKWEI